MLTAAMMAAEINMISSNDLLIGAFGILLSLYLYANYKYLPYNYIVSLLNLSFMSLGFPSEKFYYYVF